MNTFQGSINRLLNTAAVASNYIAKEATANYTAQRSEQFNKAYEAQVNAAQKAYTKSGNKSKSKAAKEAEAQVIATQPGEGSKFPLFKGVEAQLQADYDKKVKGLEERTQKGVKGLKETAAKNKAGLYKQFGGYQELAPQILKKLPAEERWKIQAESKLKQQKAYDNFLEKVKGGRE